MNSDLPRLQPYPFEKLAALKAGITPPAELSPIALSIGEPKHTPPPFVLETLARELPRLAQYPATRGMPELRQAMAYWVSRRFKLHRPLDAEREILPVNGTREALFGIAQTLVDRCLPRPTIVCPNPFYQIYEGAALLAGAQVHFINCGAETEFVPDFATVPAQVWQDCQLLYLCSPGNPTGAVINIEQYEQLLALADKHDFVIVSDECYSELYPDEQAPPPGLLEACHALGREDFSRCLVFHSLSKRSNLPGLRSGFVAGNQQLIQAFLHYRTYQGSAMAPPTQVASIAAWQDEAHVHANRHAYRAKFDAVLNILGDCMDVTRPQAGFYLWPRTPIPGEEFAQRLFSEYNVTVLPGRYLARESDGHNPGHWYVRMALVATEAECVEAAERIRTFINHL